MATDEGRRRPRVSIVVISYRRRDDLVRCVADLLAQETAVPFEVILVLQCYDDAIRTSLPQPIVGGPRIIVLSYSEPLGVYGARNVGWRAAEGEIVAFVDDDCRVGPDWLQRLVPFYSDPTVGGVGGFAHHPARGSWAHRLFAKAWGLNWPRFEIDSSGLHRMPDFDPPRETQEADWLIGCNMSFRRTVMRNVGDFDALYGNYGFDDVDYSLRVRRAGWRLIASGELTVEHNPNPASRDGHELRAFEEERHRVYFAARAIGSRRLWKLRFIRGFARHFAVVLHVAIIQRHWRVPGGALRGFVTGMRDVDVVVPLPKRGLSPRGRR